MTDDRALAHEILEPFRGEALVHEAMSVLHKRVAAALTRARQETWKLAAQEHQRHCISFDCRDNKRPCNEYETYRQRGEGV